MSDFHENLVKNQPIEFIREVVEKVYEYLLFEDKYIIDENRNLWKRDPVGMVRNTLERISRKGNTIY